MQNKRKGGIVRLDEIDKKNRAIRYEVDEKVYHLHRDVLNERSINKTERDVISRRSKMETEEAIAGARLAGNSSRAAYKELPAVSANSSVDFPIMLSPQPMLITDILVAYMSAPVSTSGSVTLDIYKSVGGSGVLINSTSAELKSLSPGMSSGISLAARDKLTLQKGQYIYGRLTSNHADAVDGSAGLVSIVFDIKK